MHVQSMSKVDIVGLLGRGFLATGGCGDHQAGGVQLVLRRGCAPGIAPVQPQHRRSLNRQTVLHRYLEFGCMVVSEIEVPNM